MGRGGYQRAGSCLLPRGTRAAASGGSATSLLPHPVSCAGTRRQPPRAPRASLVSEGPALRQDGGPRVCSPVPGPRRLEVERHPLPTLVQWMPGTQSLPTPPPGSLASSQGGQGHRWSCTCSAAQQSGEKSQKPVPAPATDSGRGSPGWARAVSSPLPSALAPQMHVTPGSSLPCCPLPTAWHTLGLRGRQGLGRAL